MRRRLDRTIAVLLLLAGAGSLALGVAGLAGLQCSACLGGVLSAAMPWTGAAFYFVLGATALRRPDARLLALAPGFYVFVHALLVADMILFGRLCAGCLGVAALALAAAVAQAKRNPGEWKGVAVAVVCGAAAGGLSTFDRVDDWTTRTLWPSRMLERAPAWVDRELLARCGHAAPLRLVVFDRDCRG